MPRRLALGSPSISAQICGRTLIDIKGLLGGALPAELRSMQHGSLAESAVQVLVQQDLFKGFGIVVYVVTVNQDPEERSATAVVSPPTAAATTGVPTACASIATRPKLSLYDGTQTTSAAASH